MSHSLLFLKPRWIILIVLSVTWSHMFDDRYEDDSHGKAFTDSVRTGESADGAEYKQRDKLTLTWAVKHLTGVERGRPESSLSNKHLVEMSHFILPDSSCIAAKDKSTIAFAWDHSMYLIWEQTWKFRYLIENRDDAMPSTRWFHHWSMQKIKFQHKSTSWTPIEQGYIYSQLQSNGSVGS